MAYLCDSFDEIATNAGCWHALVLLASSSSHTPRRLPESPSRPDRHIDEGTRLLLSYPSDVTQKNMAPQSRFSQPSLEIQPAPLLPPGESLADHPDLVWAEDIRTEGDEAAAALYCATQQGSLLPPHRVKRYETLAGKYWDTFYKNNRDRFFKDRHYLWRDFPDLVPPVLYNEGSCEERAADRPIYGGHVEIKNMDVASPLPLSISHQPSPSSQGRLPASSSLSASVPSLPDRGQSLGSEVAHYASAEAFGGESGLDKPAAHQRVLIELGCGVGNAVFPLLARDPNLFIYAFDFSPRAVAILKNHPFYKNSRRCFAWVQDVVDTPSLPTFLTQNGGQADLCLCMYALSAMAPDKIRLVAHKIWAALKPGGRVLIRDYGRWDEAQLRFKRGHRLGENFYLRSDGTRAYYFSVEDLREMFCGKEGGFREIEAGYVRRQYINRADAATRRRVWVHARFEKVCE
ncbi:hypothetical protein NSK_001286 [Nannochloropsis salina CCMP1776]|uniref:Methyltransferase type 12 domain-containing protein n=1 Tax=Nannochloropsis salina CCMP1776 TaxID=1027361 RepID=A0A4D9D926_9STRA|nr:hypothetical protein NSK_001286 [Nannochloropsis salina CCMP1776]|eukprot:TFJ87940.1 hypothetical protein NSK_001286 [Nannochloropsis salina CCMP1776]